MANRSTILFLSAFVLACAAGADTSAATDWRERPYFPVASESGLEGSATGFFHTEKIDGRDWVVDPVGRAVTITGIDHVRPIGWKDRELGYDVYARFVETNYPTKEAWLDETLGRLRDWGFNTLANHCDEPLLRHRGLAHTVTLYLGGKFARGSDPDRWITEWRGPCTGIPNVFHPDFEATIRERVRELCAPERGNPWLMGWFLDNELKWWGPDTISKDLTLFDTVRALPKTHSARIALEEYVAQWRTGAAADTSLVEAAPSASPATDTSLVGAALSASPVADTSLVEAALSASPVADASLVEAALSASPVALREGFLRLFAERYFSVLCGAIREADPDHMILGCRFAGPFALVHPVLWEVAGKYCDIVSFNCYPWADIDRGVVLDHRNGAPIVDRFHQIHGWCGKPLLVTEWSFPALDTGRPCFYGAGQRFPSQEGRARATGLFAKTMLSLPYFAGYAYFMFLDQPASGISETFREDSNYGLISETGVPYREITRVFREIHGDLSRWRALPPPGAGLDFNARPAADGPSERELYLADAGASYGSRIQSSATPPEVAFSHAGDSGWSLSGAGAEATGRDDGERLVDSLKFNGVAAGSLGALLQWRSPDGNVWTAVSPSGAPEVHRENGGVSLVFRGLSSAAVPGPVPETADGNAMARRPQPEAAFAITVRLTLAQGAASFLAEILAVENLGGEPLEFTGIYLMPYPAGVASPEQVVPSLWGAPAMAWWDLPGGMSWGAISHDSTAGFRFWLRPADGTVHPDARFSTGDTRVVLPPGATWRPAVPMGATIGLRSLLAN